MEPESLSLRPGQSLLLVRGLGHACCAVVDQLRALRLEPEVCESWGSAESCEALIAVRGTCDGALERLCAQYEVDVAECTVATTLPPRLACYLKIVREHVVEALAPDGVQKSCLASLLLVFAGIDGCGRLLHAEAKPSNKQSIKAFLEYMGGRYAEEADRLYEFRNDLVHNALNVSAYMSHLKEGVADHLCRNQDGSLIFVSTVAFTRDFSDAYGKLRLYLLTHTDVREMAERKLAEWSRIERMEHSWCAGTTPPPVYFPQKRTGA